MVGKLVFQGRVLCFRKNYPKVKEQRELLALLKRSPRRDLLANSQRRSTANPGPVNNILRGFRQVTDQPEATAK